MKNVVIIGASGHGRVIADIIKKNGNTLLGYLDDDKKKDTLGTIDDYERYLEAEFIIGIGDPNIRKRIVETLAVKWHTAIHPAAVIAEDVVIEEGTVVMANACINPGTLVGKHCIINTAAVVDHDNNLNDYVHVSVGAKLGGTVNIGEKTWIGIGAVVNNNTDICNDCTIGAGAVVVNDIKAKGTYIGIPAKLMWK